MKWKYLIYKVREQIIELIKGLLNNPCWLLMRYLGRFSFFRQLMLQWSRQISQFSSYLMPKNTIFTDAEPEQIVKTLRHNGFYLGLTLPPNIVEEILDFAQQTPCYGNRNSKLNFYYCEKDKIQKQVLSPILTGYYFNTAIFSQAINQLAQDSVLWEIASRYFQTQPKHIGNQLWWSFAVNVESEKRYQAAQFFHYDLDDFQFLKFFFYLTDVDQTSGSHVVVQGSHQRKPFVHQLRRRGYTDYEIEKT
ncbi:hypothetical protein [Chroococcus sp. FPU101]|uniref:hypothetical protein n=1 Tax=Chroococcus sp. FPU101 TaxID=1974212 RepID=UPI001A8F279A|nr:hypothetical protein [Chroococcus sp. FPU101]GFE69167.1 hypothetical protein CFPU101_17770 [Chroococcus sp. FPU101]